ncbi:hypothetical protein [Parasitella parasitica]|uniref:Uncharacterized protein n=1 Tax=Parasitella parasitica TaxID=35722 RepID=A0A0B7NNH0_9FUNG|nr:hypothetical protein [Parasitella parasitica]
MMTLTLCPLMLCNFENRLDKQKEANQEETSVSTSNKRKGGRKVKDSPEKKEDKASERKRRELESSPSTSVPVVCKSCAQTGHNSARSHDYPNHEFTLAERLCRDLSKSYQRYTVYLPFESFPISEDDQNRLMQYQQTITRLSSFLREVIYKAQVFINYYILHSADSLTNDIFEQNFWYTICRLIYGNITIDVVENNYTRLANTTAAYNELQGLENVDLLVEKEGLTGYGHVKLCRHLTDLGMIAIKKLVYGYIMDQFLINHEKTDIPESLIFPKDIAAAPGLQNTLNTLILPIKNRLPHVPLTRTEITKAPFVVLHVLRYILEYYEQQQEPYQPEESSKS